jgi:chromosome segregation ATPase|tara:strand:+ start:330 stop:542 length:213 start_codon:yes stop_codon:yes gene_type:complete
MSDSTDIINEYKDQVRILKQEVAELQDAGKSKDSANKRCLQKLEHSQQDLEIANKKITELEDEIKKKKDN